MHRRLVCFAVACLILGNAWIPLANAATGRQSEGSDASPVGEQVPTFTLPNAYGKPVSLTDFEGKECAAIVFLGTECPLAKLYGPRLNDLQEEFGDRGLQVIGINSNKQDSLTELAAYVHRHEIAFPMLKDKGNVVADAMKAERTPEVFLIDANRVVRYHGRIDDQYGVGYARDKKTRSDLAIAVEELLAGKPISQPKTEAVGCHIGRTKQVAEQGEITYTKHIAPIFNSRCVTCHREGEIAPFTLTSYDDTQGWEDTILEVIGNNRMPPWSPTRHMASSQTTRGCPNKRKNRLNNGSMVGCPRGIHRTCLNRPCSPRGGRLTSLIKSSRCETSRLMCPPKVWSTTNDS